MTRPVATAAAQDRTRPQHVAPRPRRVSRCTECLRAGIRKPDERIDRRCRYCGGNVECDTIPSTKRAHRIVRNWQANRANALKNGELIEERLPSGRVRVTRSRTRPEQDREGHQDRSKRTTAPRPPATPPGPSEADTNARRAPKATRA